MNKETLKKLTKIDLSNIYGGQIYKVKGTNRFNGQVYKVSGKKKKNSLYFVPNEFGFFIYGTKKEALHFSPAFVCDNIIACSSCEEAQNKSQKDSEIYSVINAFPFV